MKISFLPFRHLSWLIICLLVSPIALCSNARLANIQWREQFKMQCNDIWNDILQSDSMSEPTIHYLQFTRCALLQNNVEKARKFLRYYKQHGGQDTVSMHILEARILIRENNDEAAMLHLKQLHPHVNIRSILKLNDFQLLINRNASAANFAHTLEPSLNIFTFLVAAFSLYGIIVAISLLYNKRINKRSMRWLSGLIIVFSTIMLSFVMYWSSYNDGFPYLHGWWHFLYYLIGPLYYFYLSSIFEYSQNHQYRWLHFIPSILMLVIVVVTGNTMFRINVVLDEQVVKSFLSLLPKLLHLFTYLILSYKITIGDWIIDESIRWWRKVILLFYLVFLSANVVYYGLTFWSGFNTQWDYFISGIMGIGIIGIVIIGIVEPRYLQFYIKNNKNISELSDKNKPHIDGNDIQATTSVTAEKYHTSSLTAAASLSIKMKLEHLMSAKQIFKENELRLQSVADMLGVSKHHLSQVINENYSLSFFEFLNQYRIAHARELLSRPGNPYTVSEIAYQSGFNNKVTFYKVFKQYYKVTPLEYIAIKENERAMLS